MNIEWDGITVEAPNGVTLVKNGELTDDGSCAYTEGDCWVLAWHVAALMGRAQDICTVGGRDEWVHVVVRVGEDAYLDVDGVWSAAQLSRQWGYAVTPVPEHASNSWGAFGDYLRHHEFIWPSLTSHAGTRCLAEALIETNTVMDAVCTFA